MDNSNCKGASKTVVEHLPQKQINQHIRCDDDDDGHATASNDRPQSAPRKRQLRSDNYCENATNNRTSLEKEDVMHEDDDDVHETSGESGLSSRPSNADNSNKKQRVWHNKDEVVENTQNMADATMTKKKQMSGERMSKRNGKYGSTAVVAQSTTAGFDDDIVLAMIQDIENAPTVVMPLRSASRNINEWKSPSWKSVGEGVSMVLQQTTKAVSALIQRKVSSPDRKKDTSISQMSTQTQTAVIKST
jgi:hypothetical protein